MKRKLVYIICTAAIMSLCLACGNRDITDTSAETEISVSTPVSEITGTDITTEEDKEMTDTNTTSGELIQQTENIEKPESTPYYGKEIAMDSVKEDICPSKVSLRRDATEYATAKHFTYYSKTTSCERGANILLPLNYDETKKYPVLYFLHGIFGDEYSMIGDSNNRIPEIVGNLVTDGFIEDIIVVFPNMYASADPELKPGFTAEQVVPYDNFINDLTNDLIPYVEANYSVMTDREHRGIIGFSMGGRETLYIGVLRSDLFAYIGAIAPAPGVTPGQDGFMKHQGQMEEDELVIRQKDYLPKLLMVCCGTKDSVVGKFPLSYHNIMDRNGVEHLWYEVPGADHDNNAIKSGLYNFLIRWFLEK